jgi:hypothetical protein
MKGKEVERLCKRHILPELPGFAVKGNLLYRYPLGDLLCAFYFQPSAFDRHGFFLNVFVQPLYMPSVDIMLNFGKRLGFNWEFTEGSEREVAIKLLTCIRKEGLPWFKPLETPRDFAKNLLSVKDIMNNPENIHVQQAIAYSLVLIGDFSEAHKALDHFFATFKPAADAPPWQHDFAQEMASFRAILLHDPAEAQRALQRWREEKVRALKLERRGGATRPAN